MAAHDALGGRSPGRRFATLQVNHAYAILLASQFQRFSRNLNSEAADHVTQYTRRTGPEWMALMVRYRLTANRKLDRGNANPGNIGADFARFGMSFWEDVRVADPRNEGRQQKLEMLNDWRNAIAHQDFHKVPPLDASGRRVLRKADVTEWRDACDQLAVSFDRVVGEFVRGLVEDVPW